MEKIVELLKDKHNKILAILTDTDVEALGDKWYDHCIENWGTKWDMYNVTLKSPEPHILKIHATTAWSPPLEALKTISAKYPGVVIRVWYKEPGMNFMGFSSFRMGAEMVSINHEYYDAQDDVYYEDDYESDDEEDSDDDEDIVALTEKLETNLKQLKEVTDEVKQLKEVETKLKQLKEERSKKN